MTGNNCYNQNNNHGQVMYKCDNCAISGSAKI